MNTEIDRTISHLCFKHFGMSILSSIDRYWGELLNMFHLNGFWSGCTCVIQVLLLIMKNWNMKSYHWLQKCCYCSLRHMHDRMISMLPVETQIYLDTYACWYVVMIILLINLVLMMINLRGALVLKKVKNSAEKLIELLQLVCDAPAFMHLSIPHPSSLFVASLAITNGQTV